MPRGIYIKTKLHKENIGKAMKGKSAWNKGTHVSAKQLDKMRGVSKKLGLKPPSRKGIKHNQDTLLKMSEMRKGKKHWNWKGGINPINDSIRKSFGYKIWRKSVFQRDNFICKSCGDVGVKLNADHIKPFALYPELRFEISNGRTLCLTCHKKTDTYGNRSIYKKQCIAVA